jgi:hypothetical protein
MPRNQEHTLTNKENINNPIAKFLNHFFFSFNLNIQVYFKHLATSIENSKQDQTKKKKRHFVH